MLKRYLLKCLVLSSLICGSPSYAQRASDNAVRSADDAFGTTVGNESVGLYSPGDVRGFSAVQAGNVRLEGLYFDRQANFNERLVKGSSVHVGLSAQSYAFPAPTGIADYRLRLPGEAMVLSAVTGYGPYSDYYLEVDAAIPLDGEKLGIAVGAAARRHEWDYGIKNNIWNVATTLRWRPTPAFELIPFWSHEIQADLEAKTYPIAAAGVIPPRLKRGVFYGQGWADWHTEETNYGAIARAAFGSDWTVRAGVFRSLMERETQFFDLFPNTQADGTSDHILVGYPPQRSSSVSGELRLSHILTEGARRHTIQLAARARDVARLFGGTHSISVGPAVIGIPADLPQPNFIFTTRSRDKTRQWSGGVSYEGLWTGIGELSIGAQKTTYRRSLVQPGALSGANQSSPWLYNGTLALYVTDDIAVYSSYTKGLEGSGDAPSNARNRGEVVPASITKQIDGGIRYTINPGLKVVTGLFEVKKPYYNIDSTSLFTQLGSVRHRGVELSLSGRVAPDLTVVAGAVLLQARISGPLVTGGTIGQVPLGRYPHIIRLNAEYGPAAWRGLSVDGQVEKLSSRVASTDNALRLPARTTLNLGARYRFKAWETPATLRFQTLNLTNVYGWNIGATGLFEPNERRRFSVNLAMDF
jgi:iron complex outermembrane receptor protein